MIRKATLLAVALVLGLSPAGATTLVKMNFGDLARQADSIVVGTVTAIESEWGPDLNFIHTNVTLQVERSFHGATASTLVLRNPGGIVGGVGQRADGVAEFEIGERVLVFLTTWDDGTPKVLGYAQGKSRIASDVQGRQRLVGGSANGLSFDGAVREIEQGSDFNIPLRPVR